MRKIVALSNTNHKNLTLDPQKALRNAAMQQTIHLTVAEIGQAATSLPIFLMPNVAHSSWDITALTSFTAGKNLYFLHSAWDASYLPNAVQTYPFYLVNAEHSGDNFTIGLDEGSTALSHKSENNNGDDGEPLFDAQGHASAHLTQVTQLLKSELDNALHSIAFVKDLSAMNLLKAIDLVVRYEDNTTQNMTGLHTINEETLNSLANDEFEHLRREGYLLPIHAMLISLYQVNTLIKRNNGSTSVKKIAGVKLEVTRDKNQFS